METTMMLDLGNGKEMRIELISPMNGDEQVLIALNDERKLSEIAVDFETCGTMTKRIKGRKNVKEVFEGYTRLAGITRRELGDMVRITLART